MKNITEIKQQKIKNKEKGITLIALVITIIVLLILAGVSISTLTGDNGILTQAQSASDNSQISEVEERINLWIAEKITYEATKIGNEPQSDTELLEELKTEGLVEEENIDYDKKIITLYGTQISYGYQEKAFNEEEGVNNPTISDGMIPIKWVEDDDEATTTGDSWVICSQYDEDWFEYVDQETENKNGNTEVDTTSMWANIMLSDGTYDDTTAVGTKVATSDLGSMFVWIPRYSYSITSLYSTSSTTGGTIEIKFLQGITDTAVDGTSNWDNETGEGNWNVHPAFTFGDDELTGIWVAKFESSNETDRDNETATTELTVLPNVQSWVSITISTMFDAALNMNAEENNVYGISSNDSEIDPHMMLNSEWGAVVYLTQSSYGRNGVEVSPNTVGTETTGSTTSGGYILVPEQSTTGNITGVYDMSGTSAEYTASYVNNEDDNLNNNGSSLVTYSNTKYVEVYSMGTTDTQANNYAALSKSYGDAIWETSSSHSENTSWYSDYSVTPDSNCPFFVRGGHYSSMYPGLFYFSYSSGRIIEYGGFRTVLAL